MKLFYTPGACSQSPHIALREAGLAFDLVKVDLRAKKTEGGDDFAAINPKGYVPALLLDNGQLLTEGPAIVQYIADQAPAKNLAPGNGTMARYQLQSWLTFVGMELHAKFGALFTPGTPDEVKTATKARLASRFQWLDGELAGKQYLMGDTYSVADGYLFTVSNWPAHVGIDLTPYPNLVAYRARVGARPAVIAAMKAEGLIK